MKMAAIVIVGPRWQLGLGAFRRMAPTIRQAAVFNGGKILESPQGMEV
jgi:hypothetical protein